MPAAARSRASANRAASAVPRDEAVAGVAKALGHPVRIHVVRLLIEKQSCIGCDIVDEVGLAQSTVSEHLRILKAAGIITGEIERPRVCYSLNPESLKPLAALLGAVLEEGGRGEDRASLCA
jgi:ArsR family transcriptional regulator, arsenate/arsenite/antimonite-responsive transcriptional repressor